jgi:DUF1680 family protein
MQVKNNFNHNHLERERAGWFECSCCPTNVTRLLPSVPGYVYAQNGKEVFVNLFINSNSTLNIDGKIVGIEQQNNYPWDGDLKFIVAPKKGELAFSLKIRIPGWARNEASVSDLYSFQSKSGSQVTITVNGNTMAYESSNGYAVISRSWKKNDVVEVKLPMEVRRVAANNKLKDDIGKVALQRGPLMYCAEWADNNGSVSTIVIPATASFKTVFEPSLLNGVMLLKSDINKINVTDNHVVTTREPFTAIPYYAWANRGKGEMMVWFPERVTSVEIISQ